MAQSCGVRARVCGFTLDRCRHPVEQMQLTPPRSWVDRRLLRWPNTVQERSRGVIWICASAGRRRGENTHALRNVSKERNLKEKGGTEGGKTDAYKLYWWQYKYYMQRLRWGREIALPLSAFWYPCCDDVADLLNSAGLCSSVTHITTAFICKRIAVFPMAYFH